MRRIYDYSSALADPIRDYIEQQRALGRKYDKESKIFYEFDRFLRKRGLEEPELSQIIVDEWISRRPNEKRKNQRYRLNFTKRFAVYLLKNGYEAYLTSVKITTRDDSEFVPYIFTNDELGKILGYFDGMKPSRNYPNAHLVFPLLFRTLICCGLRVSEVVNLRLSDVDLAQGILLIRESKNDKQRYVPLSEPLRQLYLKYDAMVHEHSAPDAYYFPNARNNAHCTGAIYNRFREVLWHCGIEHKGRGYGPRVHDFRHTFAVRCMQKFERNQKDIMLSLPYLSVYLGHYDMSKTQKYLRLISECFPEMIEKQCEYLGDTIPAWEVSI